jgi:zinc transport system substrate-binding protein
VRATRIAIYDLVPRAQDESDSDEAHANHAAHAHGHHAHVDEPHVWLDPVLAADYAAPALTAALIRLDPPGREFYEHRLAGYTQALHALDLRIREVLDNARDGSDEPSRYIAFHNAWGHFALRYGLQEIGVVEEAGGEEPTPREIATLVRAARATDIGAILVEPQLPTRIAEIIAAEFGGKTVLVDPIGDPQDPERSTYVALMEFNARAFANAIRMRRSDTQNGEAL